MFSLRFALDQRERVFIFNISRAGRLAVLAELGAGSEQSLEFVEQASRRCASSDEEIYQDIAHYSVIMCVGAVDELLKSVYSDVLIGYLLAEYVPPERVRAHIPAAAAKQIVDSARRNEESKFGQLLTLAADSIYRANERNNFQGTESISKALRELGVSKVRNLLTRDGHTAEQAADITCRFDAMVKSRHSLVHRLGVESRSLEGDLQILNARGALTQHELSAARSIGVSIIDALRYYST